MGKESRQILEKWRNEFNKAFDNCKTLVDQFLFLAKCINYTRMMIVAPVLEELIEEKVEQMGKVIYALPDPGEGEPKPEGTTLDDFVTELTKRVMESTDSVSAEMKTLAGKKEVPQGFRFSDKSRDKLGINNLLVAIDMARNSGKENLTERIGKREKELFMQKDGVPSPEQQGVLEKQFAERQEISNLYAGVYDGNGIDRKSGLDKKVVDEVIRQDLIQQGEPLFGEISKGSEVRKMVMDPDYLVSEEELKGLPPGKIRNKKDLLVEYFMSVDRCFDEEIPETMLDAADKPRNWSRKLTQSCVGAANVFETYLGSLEGQEISLEQAAILEKMQERVAVFNQKVYQRVMQKGLLPKLKAKAQENLEQAKKLLPSEETLREVYPEEKLPELVQGIRQKAEAMIRRYGTGALEDPEGYARGLEEDTKTAFLTGMADYRQSIAALREEYGFFTKDLMQAPLEGKDLEKVKGIYLQLDGFMSRYATEDWIAVRCDLTQAEPGNNVRRIIEKYNVPREEYALQQTLADLYRSNRQIYVNQEAAGSALGNLIKNGKRLIGLLYEGEKAVGGNFRRREYLSSIRQEFEKVRNGFQTCRDQGILKSGMPQYEQFKNLIDQMESRETKLVLGYYEKKFSQGVVFDMPSDRTVLEKNALNEIAQTAERILKKVGKPEEIQLFGLLQSSLASGMASPTEPSAFDNRLQMGGSYQNEVEQLDATELCNMMLLVCRRTLAERPELRQEAPETYLDVLRMHQNIQILAKGGRISSMMETAPAVENMFLHWNRLEEDAQKLQPGGPGALPVPGDYIAAQIATVEYYRALTDFTLEKNSVRGAEQQTRKLLLNKAGEMLQSKKNLLEHLSDPDHADAGKLVDCVGEEGKRRILEEELPEEIRQLELEQDLLQMGWPLKQLAYQRYLYRMFRQVVQDLDQGKYEENPRIKEVAKDLQKTLAGMGEAFTTPQKALEMYQGLERCQKKLDYISKEEPDLLKDYRSLTRYQGEHPGRKDSFDASWKDLRKELRVKSHELLARNEGFLGDLVALGEMFTGADRFFYRNSKEYHALKRSFQQLNTLLEKKRSLNMQEFQVQYAEVLDQISDAARVYAGKKLGENKTRSSAHGIKRLNSSLAILQLISPGEAEALARSQGKYLQDLDRVSLTPANGPSRFFGDLVDETLQYAKGEDIGAKLESKITEKGRAVTEFEATLHNQIARHMPKQGEVFPRINVEKQEPGRELGKEDIALLRNMVSKRKQQDEVNPKAFETAMEAAAGGNMSLMGEMVGKLLHGLIQESEGRGKNMFTIGSLQSYKQMALLLKLVEDSPRLSEAVSEGVLPVVDRNKIKALGEVTALYEKNLNVQREMAEAVQNGQEPTQDRKTAMILTQVNYEMLKQMGQAEIAAGHKGVPSVVMSLQDGSQEFEQRLQGMADLQALDKFTRQPCKNLLLYGNERIAAEVGNNIAAAAAREVARQRNAQVAGPAVQLAQQEVRQNGPEAPQGHPNAGQA